jgi:osmoprotectant transport system permease protein
VLNSLSGTINDSIMTELNYRVDYLKQSPETVAKDFLVAHQLYKAPGAGNKGTIRIGSKIFGDGYILANMYKMLIEGNTDLSVTTKTGLGGTKIVFDALVNEQLDLYPEYTGTGLLVILNSPKTVVDSLISNKEKVYEYVSREFHHQYKIKWLKPIGFNNTYALMMRKEEARELNIKNISELTTYVNHK